MTQIKRNPQQQKIQLAPNQVYIKRPGCPDPVQTLVEGYPHWSYAEREYRDHRISLNYKGHYIISLIPANGAFEVAPHTPKDKPPVRYNTLADVAQCYSTEHEGLLQIIDLLNTQEGLEEWCLRQSFTTAKLALHLTLPQQERQRMERVARAAFYVGGLEDLAMEAIYAYLPTLEKTYHDRLSENTEELA
jgi:hypothetical protein